MTLLSRAQRWLTIFGAVYVCFVGVLLHPVAQRHVLYLHGIRYPFFTPTNDPSVHGFLPSRSRSFFLNGDGSENAVEGAHAWHIGPLVRARGGSEDGLRVRKADKLVIFLHGTAGTLAVPHRLTTYRLLTMLDGVHVLALDYRGFGAATAGFQGTPTEETLIADAVASIRWAKANGFGKRSVTVLGQSLGAAVALGAAEALVGTSDMAVLSRVVASAGFFSGDSVVRGYRLGGVLPILGPLGTIPKLQDFVAGQLVDRWDSAERVRKLAKSGVPMAFVHATHDTDIPAANSEALFATALQAVYGNATTATHADPASAKDGEELVALKQKHTVERKLAGGGVETRTRNDALVHLEAVWGGHDLVNWVDDVLLYL
ncbi:hypothetical protein PYCC9005_000122 [Savitreella phatthalungensis]